MTDKLTARLEELESQLAFQQELLEKLNDVVVRQDREMVQLRARLRGLDDKLVELGEAMPGEQFAPGDETPPHY